MAVNTTRCKTHIYLDALYACVRIWMLFTVRRMTGSLMTKIEIPKELRQNLGSEMAMDVYWVDVRLTNGRVIRDLVVRGGTFLTGYSRDPQPNRSQKKL